MNKLILLAAMLWIATSDAFVNQKCYHVEKPQTISIRVLPRNTVKAPCLVEIEKFTKGRIIKFTSYRTSRSFEACEKLAFKELRKTYASDYACEDEKEKK